MPIPMTARLRAALPLAALVALVGAAPPEALSPQLAGDVRRSFEVLTTTYYERVDPQALLAAASDSMADLAKKHGVTIAPPQMHAGPDTAATMAELDGAILQMAQDAHGDTTEYAYAAIAGMARAVGDRYTQFFTPEEFREFNEGLDPERISGIGVMIGIDAQSNVRITYVVPQTPADRAGLHPDDVIVSIDGTPAKGLKVEDASKLLRGKPGTVVNLVTMRDRAAPQQIAITRQEVQPPTVVFRMLPGNVGYVAVAAFGKATTSEFDTAVQRLKEQGAKAIALDLRNDGGGYVDTALDISSRFIANKPLLTVEERGNRATSIQADNDVSVALPTIVLVNQYTASASEITAGALQDDGVGTLIGTKTFGKGVMQTLTPLPDGAAIKVTTAHYLTPNRHDINLRGIEPDMVVDEPKDALFGNMERDPQLRAAVIYLQKKIAQAQTQP